MRVAYARISVTAPAKDNAAVLKSLPKVKVEATWISWTYQRLSYFMGYGAGIESLGWYQHVWAMGDAPGDVTTQWPTKVARLLRDADLDASSAHIIEAVRLAETLVALRQHPHPDLIGINEAVLAVLCFGKGIDPWAAQQELVTTYSTR